MFIQKLTGIIVSESQRIPYEQKEMALDTLVQVNWQHFKSDTKRFGVLKFGEFDLM